MVKNKGFEKLGDLFGHGKVQKAPAYEWQDLALRIIKEFNIPQFKRSSVFKVCKNNPRSLVIKAFDDTKELCQGKDRWKYFFPHTYV